MPIIHWTPDFAVGVSSLDTDHKVLISLINQLDDAIRAGEPQETLTRVLEALLDYTDYHFAREEALMHACGYPDVEAHIRTHNTLRAQVHDIRDRYRRNPEFDALARGAGVPQELADRAHRRPRQALHALHAERRRRS